MSKTESKERMEEDSILELKNIVSGYGKIEVLHGISLKVKKNEFITIIGPNGAGKTTTLNAILGLVDIWSGYILFKGKDITKRKSDYSSIEGIIQNIIGYNTFSTDQIIKKGISIVPQGRAIFPSLTVQENLEMGAFIRSDTEGVKKDMEKVFQKFPILQERKNQRAGSMSGGEQQTLAVGRGLMLNPDVLILDEPSLGLAPKIVNLIMEKISEINKTGTTIVLVEQNARMALEFADRCYVLEMGQVRLEGSGKDLLNDDRVKKIYLGEK
jgi:branched-chain amino acid transport system ATP-binding protein